MTANLDRRLDKLPPAPPDVPPQNFLTLMTILLALNHPDARRLCAEADESNRRGRLSPDPLVRVVASLLAAAFDAAELGLFESRLGETLNQSADMAMAFIERRAAAAAAAEEGASDDGTE